MMSRSTSALPRNGEPTFSTCAHTPFDPSHTRSDVEWLHSITRLPIVLKGVLAAEDRRGQDRVLIDGGIRRGPDVLTALALGARGGDRRRAYLRGLAVDGEQGVRDLLRLLREELELAMLSGRPTIGSL